MCRDRCGRGSGSGVGPGVGRRAGLGHAARAHAHAQARPRDRARARARARVRARGFTLVELVVTLVVLATLAVVAMPRLTSQPTIAAHQWREQLAAALMQARSLAAGHRRLLCAALAPGELRLSIATTHPAAACATALAGADGGARFVADDGATAYGPAAAALYFQPDGRITADAAGATPATLSIAIAGVRAISVVGATGWID